MHYETKIKNNNNQQKINLEFIFMVFPWQSFLLVCFILYPPAVFSWYILHKDFTYCQSLEYAPLLFAILIHLF